MHVQEGRVLLPAAAAALVLLADLVGFVEGPIESAPAAVEPAPPVIPAPPPLTRAEIFAQLPAPTPREPTDRTPVPPRTQRRRRSSGSGSTP